MAKVKLLHGMAGTRFSFAPNQRIKCTEATALRLIASGAAEPASDSTDVDGELYDDPPADAPVKRPLERAAKSAPEAAVTQGAPAHCSAKTAKGNDCLLAPVAGTNRCAKHTEG